MKSTPQASTSSKFERGFITILTGLYSFQDCVHFLASIRKFHQEPVVVLIDRVPWFLQPVLTAFGNVILKPAPQSENTVLSSRLAKIQMYNLSPFQKTIFLDADICLLGRVDELFDLLDDTDLLITEDVQPAITQATNLIRNKHEVLPTLTAAGLALKETSVQYNTGMMGFRRNKLVEDLFNHFIQYFDCVLNNQDSLLLRDQGAFAAAMEVVKPNMKILSPAYNYLDKWKNEYGTINEPIKLLHCTYPYRPQYAKNITRSLYTRVFDKIANYILPNQLNNPWRSRKAFQK